MEKFCDIVKENNIHNELDIFVLARQLKAAGKTDLFQMVFKISGKRRAELSSTRFLCDIKLIGHTKVYRAVKNTFAVSILYKGTYFSLPNESVEA